MKYLILIASCLYFITSVSFTQVPLAQIEGRLDVHLPNDTTSTHIGYKVGLNQQLFNLRYNTFVGTLAGFKNSSGAKNSFFGYHAGHLNETGGSNSFFGFDAGYFNDTGVSNSYFGLAAGRNNTTGSNNSYFGNSAGGFSTGDNNVMIGFGSGRRFSGSGNVLIGHIVGPNPINSGGMTFMDNRLFIHNDATPDPLIYGEFDNDLLRINGDLEVESQSLTLRNLGTGDDKGIIWSEDASPAFGIIYDGVGGSGDNRLHIREFIGSTSDVMTIKADGNIGIGVDNPESRLHIGGGSTSARLLFDNAGDIMWKTSSGSQRPILTLHSDDHTYLDGEKDIVFRTKSNFQERMRIDEEGNVGIGINNPNATLHIKDFAKLEPLTSDPDCSTSIHEGRIYYNGSIRKVKVCVAEGGGAYGWTNLH